MHPTPAAILAARSAAGHTQGEAAAAVGAASYRTWQDWERGQRAMSPGLWELYLLRINRHETLELRRKRKAARPVPTAVPSPPPDPASAPPPTSPE